MNGFAMRLSKLLARRGEAAAVPVPGGLHAAQPRPRLAIESGWLRGMMTWPYDPFFRPSIGLFVGHTLRQVVPTTRRPTGRAGASAAWDCCFEVELARLGADVDPAQLGIVCLETGLPLRQHRAGDTQQAETAQDMSIDEVITLARSRQRPWDCSGFQSFLDLAVCDQIDLAFRDILGRGVDPPAARDFQRRVRSGELTILDLRDRLIASSEFNDRRREQVIGRLGQWIVWGGLAGVVQAIVPSPLAPGENAERVAGTTADAGSDFVSGVEAVGSAGELGTYLGRLACGGAPRELIARWERDHAQVVAAVARRAAQRRAARERTSAPAPGRMSFTGLLGTMRAGSAGQRLDGKIRSRLGVEGHVVYGPYARLRAGTYRLVLQLHAEPPKPGRPALMWLEVNYGDVLIARLDIHDRDFNRALHTLDFSLSRRDVMLLCDAAFEFRVWTDGTGQAELLDLKLDRLGAPTATVPEQDWLPMLKAGSAGEAASSVILACAEKTGHVFYGPYRSIMPGVYLLAVECDVPGHGSAGIDIVLEVLTLGKVIAQRNFKLESGRSRIELIFDVKGGGADAPLPGPLELRLDKVSKGGIEVSRVALALLAGGADAE